MSRTLRDPQPDASFGRGGSCDGPVPGKPADETRQLHGASVPADRSLMR